MKYQITSFELLKQMLQEIPEGNACVEWPRARSGNYGRLMYNGNIRFAHRVAYIIAVGPIPEGLHVCHSCDNPPCFRPSHLFPGTDQDNVDDCARKNRARKRRGCAVPGAKLNEDKVLEIFVLRLQGWSKGQLARQFKVDHKTIRKILNRDLWKHVNLGDTNTKLHSAT